jgi:hypothetical protein
MVLEQSRSNAWHSAKSMFGRLLGCAVSFGAISDVVFLYSKKEIS